MPRVALRAVALMAGALLLLQGCAWTARQPPVAGAPGHWSGRLALEIRQNATGAEAGEGTRNFSATFDLQGHHAQGQLLLLSPLGSSLARLRWQPGQATLERPGQPPVRAGSLEQLAQDVAGADAARALLPVAALIDWLQGRQHRAAAAAWQADLSRLAQGRIQARHVADPQATLRLVLDAQEQKNAPP